MWCLIPAGSCRKTFNEASVTSLKGIRDIIDFFRCVGSGGASLLDVDARPENPSRLKSPIILNFLFQFNLVQLRPRVYCFSMINNSLQFVTQFYIVLFYFFCAATSALCMHTMCSLYITFYVC